MDSVEDSHLVWSRDTLHAVAGALLGAGLLLRLYFLWRHAFLAGDSILYQEIGENWLRHHVYGLSTAAAQRPTLIRLPGYPAILAALSWLATPALHGEIGTLRSFLPVLYLQIAADLGTCWLIAEIAGRLFGSRARIAALALSCLCPFLANYTAVPLTETFTLFFLALSFWALQRWQGERRTKWLVWLSAALACSILLRPDQGLLAAAILPAIALSSRMGQRFDLRAPALCIALIALPFLPWTLRNARTFHVFQPLAPKLATDPGEQAPISFQRWYRTWAVDFSSTEDAYWKYPEETVLISDLPTRAFANDDEEMRLSALLRQAGVDGKLSPYVEAGFAQLAIERIHSHPLEYYALLPTARVANMLLHPRVEMLPVAERWWQFRAHPWQTVFAVAFALLNLGYLALGCMGAPAALRANRTLALAMIAYVLLRCALLLTLDNAEQRYTLELYPIAIVFAAGALCSHRRSMCSAD